MSAKPAACFAVNIAWTALDWTGANLLDPGGRVHLTGLIYIAVGIFSSRCVMINGKYANMGIQL